MKELKKILYAEDDLDIQTIVETIIDAMSNYKIKICNNGRELLECVEDYNPDLILLDVMMPEVDGPSAFKALQADEKFKNIPVIFMTAKAQVHEVQSFMESGVIGIITKPFDPIQLIPLVTKIWEDNNVN